MTTEVTLLLGSNAEDAAAIVERAITIIANSVGEVVRSSKEYRSEAYGFTAEREFVNRAITIVSEYDAYEVLRKINLIEALLGRDRQQEQRVKEAKGEAYASRPIDIDIIFYGTATFADERLTIPYHYLDEREYALRPVAEIAPNFKHPALTHTPKEMLQQISNE